MMQKVAAFSREFLLRMSGFKSGGWDAENILKKIMNTREGVSASRVACMVLTCDRRREITCQTSKKLELG